MDDPKLRETGVLIHVARGLPDREIAERLYLGETTIETYIGNMLTKPSLPLAQIVPVVMTRPPVAAGQAR
jgi:hypothetical protein